MKLTRGYGWVLVYCINPWSIGLWIQRGFNKYLRNVVLDNIVENPLNIENQEQLF